MALEEDPFEGLPEPKHPEGIKKDGKSEAKRASAGETGGRAASWDTSNSGHHEEIKTAESQRKGKGVEDFLSSEDGDDHTTAAIRKIGAHVNTSSGKLRRCLEMLIRLVTTAEIERKHGKEIMHVLEKAMEEPENANKASLRVEFRRLFESLSVLEERGVFNRKQRRWLDIWRVRAILANDLFTDESYEFSRAVGRVKKEIDDLPEPASLPGNNEAPELPSLDGLEGEEHEKVLHARKAQEAERREEVEEAERNRERQSHLISCLEAAEKQYSKPWARATVDLLVDKAHANLHKFEGDRAKDRLQQLYDRVKEARSSRKRSAPDTEMTSFEMNQAKFRSAAISARKPVGAETGVDGRGESAVDGFGKPSDRFGM